MHCMYLLIIYYTVQYVKCSFALFQEDMRMVIYHQVELQQQEKEKENKKEQTGFQRGTRTTKSLRVRGEDGRKGFFSTLFGGD